ncbi:MAG: ABC transporter ATP-binding protein [Phycisphaerae bacterium]|nr:ABC transporter ATP-binding protein [Phycisphaerae bacterium]
MNKLVRRTWGLLDGHEQRQLGLLVMLMIVQACLEVISIGSILPFMALLERPEAIHTTWFTQKAYESLGFTTDRNFLIFSGLCVLGLFVIVNAVNALSLCAQAHFSWMRSFSISRRLLRSYLSQPYTFFLRRNSADFTRNIYQEVRQVIVGLILPGVILLSRSISISLILALLLYINWAISLGIAVVFTITYAIVFMVSRKALKQIGTRIVSANEACYRVTNEAFGGIKEAKLRGMEQVYVDAFSPQGYMVARMNRRRVIISGTPRYILETVAFGSMLVLVLILLSTSGSISTIIPTLSVFAFAGYRLMPSLSQIFVAIANIRSSTASLDVVVADLKKTFPKERHADRVDPFPLTDCLELSQVAFEYETDERHILEGVDLSIRHGESIAIVGSTGAGKTTLLDILLGLLEPTMGTMKIDGIPVTPENVRGWQSQIGYVPQNIFLSDDSIRRNIAFGIPDEEVSQEQVEYAGSVAGLHEFITSELPDGYWTPVGERGVRLSGGQIQRLGIARAIYHDPSVIFLDEATSALDSKTEKQVMDGLRKQAEDRTVIIIAHRLTTVRFCDRIVVLDSGRISDIGTWDELIDRNETFRQLAGEDDGIQSLD